MSSMKGIKGLMAATGLFGVGLVAGMILRPAVADDSDGAVAAGLDEERVRELNARIDAAEAKAKQRRAAMSQNLQSPPVPHPPPRAPADV
jgi:hypothetical protein